MNDVTDLRFARLGGMLDGAEEKAAAPAKPKPKGPKVRPKPPWLDPENDDNADGSDDDGVEIDFDADDDASGHDVAPAKRKPGRAKKALPSSQKPPSGWTNKKPMPAQNTAKARRKQTVTSPRGNMARVQHSSRGQRVSMWTLPAPKGIKAKSAAPRPTVWGPPSQAVDITRARVQATGNDGRLNAASRQRSNGPQPKPGTGSAGGNGVSRGRGDTRANTRTPENVRKPAGRGKVRHSGEMGEGAAWGRSGSAITPHKPGNLKSLYDFTPGELQSAIEVAAKAIRGVIADHESGED